MTPFPHLHPWTRTVAILALLLGAQVCVAIAFLHVPSFGIVPRDAGPAPYWSGALLAGAAAILLAGPRGIRLWGALQLLAAAVLLLLPAIVLAIWLQTDGDPGAGYRITFVVAFLLPGGMAAIVVKDALRP